MWIEIIDVDDQVILNVKSIESILPFKEEESRMVYDKENETHYDEISELSQIFDEELGIGSGVLIKMLTGDNYRIYDITLADVISYLRGSQEVVTVTTSRWYLISNQIAGFQEASLNKLSSISRMISGLGYHFTGSYSFSKDLLG